MELEYNGSLDLELDVYRRAASSRSVDGLCAVLNEECAVLESRVAAALRRSLRSAPALVLPLAGPATAPAAAPAPSLLAQRLSRDVDAQRMLFLVSYWFVLV